MSDLFIALLNPALALVFATAFLATWMHQRRRPYLLGLAAGYLLTGAGFMLQHFVLPLGLGATKLLSNVCFTLAICSVATAVCMRRGRKAPIAAFAILGPAGLAAFSWFMFVDPDLTWRIYVMHFALGGICLVVAAELRAIPGAGTLDRVLLAVAVLAGANFMLRPPLTVWMHGPYASYDGFYQTAFWGSTILSHALFSVVVALALLSSAMLDVIGDLKAESHTDPLSGLLNRRGFEARAQDLLERCRKARLPVTLVLADLDRFKILNDRFGHAAGDRVICEFASRLKMAGGFRGVAGRLGGEEFAVLLPCTDLAGGRKLAEAVRSVFSAGTIDGVPPDAQTTASFGVAARSGDEPFAELFARADEALYRAKRSGRDGVRASYQRPAEPPPAAILRSV